MKQEETRKEIEEVSCSSQEQADFWVNQETKRGKFKSKFEGLLEKQVSMPIQEQSLQKLIMRQKSETQICQMEQICEKVPRIKYKYIRKKDQNRFKEFHSVAYKTLKQLLKIKKMAEFQPFRHRHDYFIMILICAEFMGVLHEFAVQYQRNSQHKIKNRESNKFLQQFKKHKQKSVEQIKDIEQSYMRSFNSLSHFLNNDLASAIESLYDIQNLKGACYPKRALQQMQNFSQISKYLESDLSHGMFSRKSPKQLLSMFERRSRIRK